MKRTQYLAVAAFGLMLSAQSAFSQVVVRVGPPPPRREVIVASPGAGYVWHRGYYAWDGGRYNWVGGTWVLPPHPGGRWVDGHWAHRGGGWVWVEGHWR